MSVVNSQIIEDAAQRDGRRWITERHTLDDGSYQDVTYMAGAKDKVTDMLPIRAAQIEESIAAQRQTKDEQAAAEKARAVALLELADDKIAAILKVSLDKVPDEKSRLADVASDVSADVVEGK
jgi:hypothetical protein